MGPLLIGIDLGTSALKCGVWDTHGQCHGRARIPYPTRIAQEVADQDPNDYWRVLGVGLREAVSPEVAPHVAAIGVGGHGPSPVFVDASLEPVARVPTWMDRRREEDVAFLSRTFAVPSTGPQRLAMQLAAMGRWLARNSPDCLASARWTMHAGDYLVSRLVGRPLATHASPEELFDAAGLPHSLLPAPAIAAGDIAGSLTSGAADMCGLRQGLPVVAGGLDAFLGVLGGGISRAGEASLNLGSSTIASLVASPPTVGRFALGTTPVISDVLPFGATTLRWLGARLGRTQPVSELVAEALADQSSQGDHEGFDCSEQLVATVEQGLARGLAHNAIVRRVVEGMERTHLARLLERARPIGPLTRLTCIGGMAIVDTLHQLRADACGVCVEIPCETAFGTALGGATLAAVATGTLPSHREAAAAMVTIDTVYEPGKP